MRSSRGCGWLPTKNSLGRRDRASLARVELHRLAHRPGKALVDAFADVVVVAAVQQLDVQRDAHGLREFDGTALYEQGQADDWTVLLGQAVHYRDPDGRAVWSTLDATGPSHSSDWARSHSIDLTVEETDYEP